MRKSIEMLNAIKKIVADLAVLQGNGVEKSKIQVFITEMSGALREQCKEALVTIWIHNNKVDMEANLDNNPRSWTQIISSSWYKSTLDIHLEIAKWKQLEKLKKKCMKTEVMLFTWNTSDNIQKNI